VVITIPTAAEKNDSENHVAFDISNFLNTITEISAACHFLHDYFYRMQAYIGTQITRILVELYRKQTVLYGIIAAEYENNTLSSAETLLSSM